MLLMVSGEAPVLVKEAARGLEAAARVTFPKFRLAGTSFTLPAVTVTVAVSDFEASVTEVAVRVTVGFADKDAGEV
jgi:hypothetical protein